MLQLVQKYLSSVFDHSSKSNRHKMIRQPEGLRRIPASNDNPGLLASCVNALGVS